MMIMFEIVFIVSDDDAVMFIYTIEYIIILKKNKVYHLHNTFMVMT